jgi:hypothetical protein
VARKMRNCAEPKGGFTMARAKLNALFTSISGKLGDLVVAERQGKFFVRKLRTRTTPPSPAELERRAAFRQAAAYGKMVQNDFTQRAIYAPAAKLRQMSPYQVALTDFLNRPTVDEIDFSRVGEDSGSLVRIEATDDFQVVEVQLSASLPGGPVLEQGAATLDSTIGCWWYRLNQPIHPNETIVFQVTAFDRPRNHGSKTVFWRLI